MKIRFIPNGVNTKRFHLIDKKMALKYLEKHDKIKAGNKKIILFIGQLKKEKGIINLIKAMKKVDSAILLAFGAGRLRQDLISLIENKGLTKKVFLLGVKRNEDLFYYYNAADLTVISSQKGYEGFPNVMLESFACGTPVLSTKTGEGPYIIKDYLGKIINNDSVKLLSSEINKILKRKFDRKRIRKFVEQNYKYSEIAKKIFDIKGKRICFFNFATYPITSSGMGTQVFELAKQLSKDNDVSIITARFKGTKRFEKKYNIKFYRVALTRKIRRLRRLTYCINAFFYSLKFDFDIVEGRDWHGAFAAALYGGLKKARIVTAFRGFGALTGYKKPLVKILVKLSNEVTANSHEQVDYIKKLLRIK